MRKSLVLGLLTFAATPFVAWGHIELDALPSVSATAGGFTWNYTSNVTPQETVSNGAFFTIYDFGNFTGGSNLQPAGWTFSSSLVTTPPTGLTVTDNPSLANLTWTYTGATPINGAALLGQFSVVANTNLQRDGDYASQATSTALGSTNVNRANVGVPIPEMSALLPILSICGAGFAASVPSLLRRRKKS